MSLCERGRYVAIHWGNNTFRPHIERGPDGKGLSATEAARLCSKWINDFSFKIPVASVRDFAGIDLIMFRSPHLRRFGYDVETTVEIYNPKTMTDVELDKRIRGLS